TLPLKPVAKLHCGGVHLNCLYFWSPGRCPPLIAVWEKMLIIYSHTSWELILPKGQCRCEWRGL
uniref:Uncharacterized protein n=1 Tax=Apteryx owenii TaxID=8824 RepID=A0A8B9S807_APTOW